MRRTLLLVWCGSILAACAARTELSDLGDMDASTDDAAADATLDHAPSDDAGPPDTSIDVFDEPPAFDAPDEPPLFDAPDEPPIDDAGPDVIGPLCPADCTSNFECQQQCTPHLSSGRYCCDQQTATCYAFAHHFCPPIIFDAGFD
jgi:hypothetical protein